MLQAKLKVETFYESIIISSNGYNSFAAGDYLMCQQNEDKEVNTTDRIRALLVKYYTIGELLEVKQNFKGFVNKSYEIKTEKNGQIKRYFIKEYARGTKKSEIQFEHSIIKHLLRKKFKLVAGIASTNDGTSYVDRVEEKENFLKGESTFYAVFDFLTGEDRYRWDNPPREMLQLQNAATVLAQYHINIFDLNSNDINHDGMIVNLLPKIAQDIKNFAKKTKEMRFDNFLRKHLELIQHSIDSTHKIIDSVDLSKIPKLPVHGDYHPANLKYQNENISGLFDFDWAMIDSRCFDVALSIPYFCGIWTGEASGEIDLNRANMFLGAYQRAFKGHTELGCLSEVEIKFLKYFLKAGNLYILNWIVMDFYRKDVDKDLYFQWLEHTVKVVKWLEADSNFEDMGNMIASLAESGKC